MKEEALKNNKSLINIIQLLLVFPSPAENYIEEYLDLNKYLINNLESTFFIRVSGNSMNNTGINNNDLLIVDNH